MCSLSYLEGKDDSSYLRGFCEDKQNNECKAPHIEGLTFQDLFSEGLLFRIYCKEEG